MRTARATSTVDGLFALALSRPRDALARATDLLNRGLDDRDASIAHQARAIALRDTGHVREAVADLHTALRHASSSGDRDRVTDVRATLGLTLGLAGRTRAGLILLDQAAAESRGAMAGRVLMRRGHILAVVGRYDEALADFGTAVTALRRAGDGVWEARTRVARFSAYARLGQASRGDRDLAVAERLFTAAGQELESAIALHNRADVAFQLGDLPAALGFLDEVEVRYSALGVPMPELAIDRCAVLLAAGLAEEAVEQTERAIRQHTRAGQATKTAELLFAVARAALAAGLLELASERAAAARVLFGRQGREGWQARAAFVAVQARYAKGERGGRLGAQAARLADRLDGLHAFEAPAAHLLGAHLAADQGRVAESDRHLALAERYRHRGPPFGRPAGWLAHALRAEQRGATAAMLAACRRGLGAAAEHQRTLAAAELRAYAAAYGADLAMLAQRHAVKRGDGRMLLRWSERWRAGALAVPPVRPPDDRELANDLGALRSVVRALERAQTAGGPTDRLDQDRRRLEAAIRARTRRAPGERTGGTDPSDLAGLIAGLGSHRLVEITAVDDGLHATTVSAGRVRTYPVAPLANAVREVQLARFLLRRLAHGRPPPDSLARLEAAGAALQDALLGSAVDDLGAGPVVVVPPAVLHAVPWALLPALRDVETVVTPSAATWLRARRQSAPRRRRVALIIGPGLDGTAAELTEVAARYPEAVVLDGGRATAEATLAALDGAWTAHIAAHGVFRADNPLFSALILDDGPLTVYDLGRLRRAPVRLVLSSCESAVAKRVGADELLGIASALVPLGTASIVASVVPVNDAVTGQFMARFHERLCAGLTFGAALCGARVAAHAEPISAATALSFVSLGA